MSTFKGDSMGPPEKKRPDGGQAIRAKQQAGSEQTFAKHTLRPHAAASHQNGAVL